jgi:hypothetical protein
MAFSSGLPAMNDAKRWPGAGRTKGVWPAFGEVGDAWGEADAQHMRQREHMIAGSAAVRVVGGDADVCLVVEQSADDVRRLAGAGDRRGVEWRMAVRDVRRAPSRSSGPPRPASP